MKSAALALAFAASALAEDVAPSFADNPVPPKVTAPPSGPQPDAAQVAGPLTIHVTNSFGLPFQCLRACFNKINEFRTWPLRVFRTQCW